jgi:hypothetical protein
MKLIENYASESGHWYKPDGTPAYSIIGANGKERNTTLRDAKKLGLLPSVTTIIRQAVSPGLENWKQQQILLSALTLPRNGGETEDEYAKRVIKDSREQSKKAMELGTSIHGSLEKALNGVEYDKSHQPHVQGAMNAINSHFGDHEWKAEKSFANPLGYGGKVDLHSDNVVIDFKTKEFTEDNLPDIYDEHIMQLAAYSMGVIYPSVMRMENGAAILFVSTSKPGLCHVVNVNQEELGRGWGMFKSLLGYWKAKNL